MRSVTRSLTATKNYGFRASHLMIMLGLAVVGSQLLARPISAQQGGGNSTLAQRLTALESANTLLQAKVTDLTNELATVKDKTAPITVTGDDFKIIGKNVYIQDGSGQTESQTGLGNLTVGYNSLREPHEGDGINSRTGAHNLIVGEKNNYTHFGGFVAGFRNDIREAYCSVSGGVGNRAFGPVASVSGGLFNTASGHNSSVSGGLFNTASGTYSSVSGGHGNTASGIYSSVSGGSDREAPGQWNWRAGDLFQPQ